MDHPSVALSGIQLGEVGGPVAQRSEHVSAKDKAESSNLSRPTRLVIHYPVNSPRTSAAGLVMLRMLITLTSFVRNIGLVSFSAVTKAAHFEM
jgi:hypothetical protein